MLIENYLDKYITQIMSEISTIGVDLQAAPYYSKGFDPAEILNEIFGSKDLDSVENIIPNYNFSILSYNYDTPFASENMHRGKCPLSVVVDDTNLTVQVANYTQMKMNLNVMLLTNDIDYSGTLLQYFLCELNNRTSMSATMLIGTVHNSVKMNLTHENLIADNFVQEIGDNESLHTVSWSIEIDAPIVSPVSDIYVLIEKAIINIYQGTLNQNILYKTLEK